MFANKKIVVLFEGPDKCGKTTMARQLVDHVNETGVRTAVYVKFPTSLDYRTIDDARARADWFYEDQTRHQGELIAEAAADVVVVDRYFYSQAIYDQVTTGREARARSVYAPDICVFLHHPRADYDTSDELESNATQSGVRALFHRALDDECEPVDHVRDLLRLPLAQTNGSSRLVQLEATSKVDDWTRHIAQSGACRYVTILSGANDGRS